MKDFKTLKEVCELLNVTRRIVQGYEKKGLVHTDYKDKFTLDNPDVFTVYVTPKDLGRLNVKYIFIPHGFSKNKQFPLKYVLGNFFINQFSFFVFRKFLLFPMIFLIHYKIDMQN